MTPYLPADVARCRPGCAGRGDTCARLQAPLPAFGGSIVDGAKAWPGSPCFGYIPLGQAEEAPPAPRRVHPPL